jgi:hypothetical protein
MIELTETTMQNAIAKAKAERNNLTVRLTSAVRMYRVESKSSSNVYTVNFSVRDGRRFGHCNCKAGEAGKFACKHIAAAAALNMALAEAGRLNKQPAVSVNEMNAAMVVRPQRQVEKIAGIRIKKERLRKAATSLSLQPIIFHRK